MSLFKKAISPIRIGAVFEIGSGSVLISIIRSDNSKNAPEVVWSKREYVPRRSQVTTETSVKNIVTSIMSSVLLLDSEGKKSLEQKYPKAKIEHIQATITSPWSFTITKVINYTNKQPFYITEQLLLELQKAAEKKINEDLKEDELATERGLDILTRVTTDIEANDYKVKSPIGQQTSTITLTQIAAAAPIYLVGVINDICKKVLPRLKPRYYSFMLMYYCIVRDIYTEKTEYCLVDITFEATEIGIVRGGILRYCSNTPIGISTLARTVSNVLDLPIDEAYSFLKEPYHTRALETLSKEKLVKFNIIMNEYQTNIKELFLESGDKLSIPKTIFLHGGHQVESFFAVQISTAANMATKFQHTVHQVTRDLLTTNYTEAEKKALLTVTDDSAMLVAAQFFHKQQHTSDFIQL